MKKTRIFLNPIIESLSKVRQKYDSVIERIDELTKKEVIKKGYNEKIIKMA